MTGKMDVEETERAHTRDRWWSAGGEGEKGSGEEERQKKEEEKSGAQV